MIDIMHLRKLFTFSCTVVAINILVAQSMDSTYAEKLGFPKGSKVVILHVDDVGMSYDSNEGAIKAMTHGVATSCSVMMPCPWVPSYIHYLKSHAETDAGLHLTLTSEWKEYRWGPLSGKTNVPGLTDTEGDLWPDVSDVVQHATAEEVGKEIKAQLDRARGMGFEPTHLDSHMGTLFATPAYLMKYITLGIENHIPVMLPAGHSTLILQQTPGLSGQVAQIRTLGKKLWDSGLPVLDDLHNDTYGWKPDSAHTTDNYKTPKYIEALRSLKPGITMIIMHCTATTNVFQHITDSGASRKADLLAMIDPAFKQAIADQGIILTTWRELKKRRDKM